MQDLRTFLSACDQLYNDPKYDITPEMNGSQITIRASG
jgi:hypothetical protein